VWKYLIISFLLVGFVFFYPQINKILELPFSYHSIVVGGSLLLIFVVTPLYWRAMHKQGQQERENNKRVKQPWD